MKKLRSAYLVTSGSVLLIALMPPLVQAQTNGSWAVDADGVWSSSGNWTGGNIADGTGATASFINDITATRTVTLDSSRTIGSIVTSDNGASGSTWIINNGANVLTMATGSGTPTFNIGTATTIIGSIGGSGGILKTGAGDLVLSGVNSFTGGIAVSGGSIRLTAGGSSANAPSQSITLNGGKFIWDNTSGSANKNFVMGAAVGSTGDNVLGMRRGSGINSIFTLNSISRNVGATITLEVRNTDGTLIGANPGSGTNIINVQTGGVLNASNAGLFIEHSTGVDYAIANGNGVASMRTPVYGTTSGFSDAGATLVGTVATNNLVTTSISGQTTASVRTIKFNGASAVDLGLADNAVLTLGIGGLLRTGGGATTIGGIDASVTTTTDTEFVFNTVSASDSLTLNADILGTGTNALTKAGAGVLILGGENSYIGNTYVNSGTLNLLDDAELRFSIGASGTNNRITGLGTVNLGGDFVFDLTGAGSTVGDTWTIVDVSSLTESYLATFSVAGFTETEPGVWTSGGYRFTESTGQLTVVPEPSPAVVLAALGVVLPVARRRKRL